jgi:dephospho-CoA kinase
MALRSCGKMDRVFNGKPIIGIAGGIGSGKTYIARLLGELGCLVIEADALVREAYDDPAIRAALRTWWGGDVFDPRGQVNRSAIAQRVFNHPSERIKLEQLLHPWVDARRAVLQEEAPAETVAFVWDTPLLFETGLNARCDAVVFVDVPQEIRVMRVKAQRGWDEAELLRRENLQLPLDKKRQISDYVLTNSAVVAQTAPMADDTRNQVRLILSRIVAGLPRSPQRA